MRQNQDPQSDLNSAEIYLKKILPKDPDSADLQNRIGLLELLKAEWKMRIKQSPTSHLEKAREAFDKALKVNKDSLETQLGLAEYYYLNARWNSSDSQAAQQAMDQCKAMLANIFAVYPKMPEALALRNKL